MGRARRAPRTGMAMAAVAGLAVGLAVALAGPLPALSAPSAAATPPPPPLPNGTRPATHPLVYPGGGAVPFGDARTAAIAPLPSGLELNSRAMAMALTNDGHGYWIAGADGGVYSLGDAPFYGSLGNRTLNGPVVGFAPTADDGGYRMVALDGGVFAFGDAQFYGSMGGAPLNEPVEAMASTPDGRGYWLVASDGGIFSFGDAQFYGSMGGAPLNAGVSAMATTRDGRGYWMVGGDGSVFSFGDATFYGSAVAAGGAATPYAELLPTPDGGGYWLFSPDQLNDSYANPPPGGSFPGSAAIVAAAQSQVQPDPDTGYFCNPYGPCEEWCALFVTWAVQQGGIQMPTYAFTGDIFNWGASRGAVLGSGDDPVPGDIALFGTGPDSADTSFHTGIVAQVWPDGAIITIEGDAGPGQAGRLAVVTNGPYLPADSPWYNGVGIYAFVRP